MREIRSGAYAGQELNLPSASHFIRPVHHNSSELAAAFEDLGNVVLRTHLKVSTWLASCSDLSPEFFYMVVAKFSGIIGGNPDLDDGGLYLLNDRDKSALEAFNVLVSPLEPANVAPLATVLSYDLDGGF